MQKIFERSRHHWSFQPIQDPRVPPVPPNGHSIDAFVLARLKPNGLNFAKPADRQTLIRRLYHDLLGLKPSFPQVQAFIADRDPQAYANLVDDLLASPDSEKGGEGIGWTLPATRIPKDILRAGKAGRIPTLTLTAIG